MPTPPHRPPSQIPVRSFTRAEAIALGLTRHQLENPAYELVTRGVWARTDRPEPGDPAARILEDLYAIQHTKPDTVASHVTAGVLLALRLPGPLRMSRPIHLTRISGRHRPTGDRIAGHLSRLPADDILCAHAVLLTGPARTLVDIAAMQHHGRPLLSDDQLVGLIDGVICEHGYGPRAGLVPLRSRAALEAGLVRWKGHRGVARVRRALTRAAAGVDSAMETRARLLLAEHDDGDWVTDLELRAPGFRPVWPDLADTVHRLSLQLEGPHHDSAEQRVRDIERARATAAAGWQEVRATDRDLRSVARRTARTAGPGRGGPPSSLNRHGMRAHAARRTIPPVRCDLGRPSKPMGGPTHH